MADRFDYDRDRDRMRHDDVRDRARGREDDRYRGDQGEDRGLVQRAGDEVRSWFGDDDAAHRRRRDEAHERSEQAFERPGYGREHYGRDRTGEYQQNENFRATPSGSARTYPDRSRDTGRWGGQHSMGSPEAARSFTDQGFAPPFRGEQGDQRWDRWESFPSRTDGGATRADWSGRGAARSGSSNAWSEPGPYTGRGPRGYQRSDERIREDICDRLTRHGQIDATDLRITVSKGEVTLEGTIGSREGKRLAEDVAESVDGVRDVTNHIKAQSGWRGDRDDRSDRSDRTNPENDPSRAGLGNPGTPSTLGLSGNPAQTSANTAAVSEASSNTSASATERKR